LELRKERGTQNIEHRMANDEVAVTAMAEDGYEGEDEDDLGGGS
jgi:hypothetical protein